MGADRAHAELAAFGEASKEVVKSGSGAAVHALAAESSQGGGEREAARSQGAVRVASAPRR
jgi:hypothetical protein